MLLDDSDIVDDDRDRRRRRRVGDRLHVRHGHHERRGRFAIAVADFHDSDIDFAAAGIDQSDLLRRGVRQIDHPIADERSAIVDAHAYDLSRLRVRDVDHRTERQCAMRSREQQRIENLAVRGRASRELLTIPTRHAVQCQRRRNHRRWLRSGTTIHSEEDDRRHRHPEPRRRRRTRIPAEALRIDGSFGVFAPQDDRLIHTRRSSVTLSTRSPAITGSTCSITNRSVCCFASPV